MTRNCFDSVKPRKWAIGERPKWENTFFLIKHDIKHIIRYITDHTFDNIDGLLVIISWYLEREVKDIGCFEFNGELDSESRQVSDLCHDIITAKRRNKRFWVDFMYWNITTLD